MRTRRRTARLATAGLGVILTAGALAACGGGASVGPGGQPVLNWYVNPDGGGQASIAARCTEASDGAYVIEAQTLPRDAASQREQLVRRLAAEDDSIDIMSIDPPFTAEFETAGFLAPVPEDKKAAYVDGVLDGAVTAATYDDELVAVPFWSNTQLLWYRKSAVADMDLDLDQPVTWDQIIQASASDGKEVEVQAQRAETYAVFINALISSAGGQIVEDPEAGADAEITIDSQAGEDAAAVIQELVQSGAANPAISTAAEGEAQAAFFTPAAAFMTNWAYIYGVTPDDVKSDLGWTRWPEVVEGEPSAPPFGGINLGVSSYSNHQDLSYDAIDCITSIENGKQYWLDTGNPASRAAVFEDPEIIKTFPMAPLLKTSIDAAVPRPVTPYWAKIGPALYDSWHSPTSVDPDTTPEESQQYVQDVLAGKALL